MKIVRSYSAMFCFMVVIVAFFTTTCKSCDLDYKLGPFDCPTYKRIYIIYKKLESILTNDTVSLHLMRQAFFQASVTHFSLETERVNVVPIAVCWVPNKTRPPPACNSLDRNNQTAITEMRCWNFRWSGLPALNIIAVEQLLAFDPVLTSWIYSRFVDHTYRKFLLVFDISPDLFSCTPSEDDLTQATVLLLTWVSVTIYTHPPSYSLHAVSALCDTECILGNFLGKVKLYS